MATPASSACACRGAAAPVDHLIWTERVDQASGSFKEGLSGNAQLWLTGTVSAAPAGYFALIAALIHGVVHPATAQ